MDKLKAFESFVSVAVRGSLTAAAKAEGVAPAIMGRRLDALEEHLGVKLLVRTTRRISLTHEGSAFLEDCQRLLSDVANAEASVSEGGVKATGHLRITAPAGFGRRHVAPLVPRFRSAHPDVTISLNLSDRVVDLAGEGYDCAVRKRGTSGATWRRPKPAGAVMRKCPVALTPPSDTLASALATSDSRRWQSSRNALPSCVRLMRRVVRTSSFTPRCSSSASSRRPMMAGATPSALAAAVRLPRTATDTNDSKALSLSMGADYGDIGGRDTAPPGNIGGAALQAKTGSSA